MNRKILTVAVFLVIGMSSCSRTEQKMSGRGDVLFDFTVSEDVSFTRNQEQRELPDEVIPASEDFSLKLSSESGIVGEYASMAEYDQPMLQAGDYTATVLYGDPEAEGPDAACFDGSKTFTVVARKTISETIAASLSNSAFSVKFSEWFNNYYESFELKIETETGYQLPLTGSVEEKPSAETEPVFTKAGTNLYISGSAVKTNGFEVMFPRTLIGTTKERTWSTVNIKADEVSQLGLEIVLDDTPVSVNEVAVELNPDA